MKECVITKNEHGKFVISEMGEEVGTRVEFENMAKEDGVKLARLDGDLPKWARKAAEGFFENLETTGLQYAYAQQTEEGVLLVGLVK